jgi:hypothetical protein
MKVFLWIAQCLAFCLFGILLCSQLHRFLTPVIWWLLHRSGSKNLAAAQFSLAYFPILVGLYGLALGFIPLRWLKESLHSIFSHFSHESPRTESAETDNTRPILWAWLPVAPIFLVRFISFGMDDRSVLSTVHPSRPHYFFGNSSPYSLDFFNEWTRHWMFDRMLSGWLLFLVAYPIGVWLRHHRSSYLALPTPPDSVQAP